MSSLSISAALIAAIFSLLPAAASAHATLETRQAPAGSYYKAVLGVSHGCKGSPTTAVRIQIPQGITSVKPQPKQGWDLEIVREPSSATANSTDAAEAEERVSEVHWTGGRLLDEHYDEFVLQVRLPDLPGETIYFPTVQECEEGVHRWIEIPEEGRSRSDYDEPAPQVILTPRN